MKGYTDNIEQLTLENTDFRKVLYTAKHMQLVLMSLKAGEEIGEEIHAENDQFFRFEKGCGTCMIDGNKTDVKEGDAIVVPAGSTHNIINSGTEVDLKMYTIYSPPHHQDGIIRKTKAIAEAVHESYDGVTTE